MRETKMEPARGFAPPWECKMSNMTPVLGGVGPMTVTMLLKNVFSAYAFERAMTNVLTGAAIGLGTYGS